MIDDDPGVSYQPAWDATWWPPPSRSTSDEFQHGVIDDDRPPRGPTVWPLEWRLPSSVEVELGISLGVPGFGPTGAATFLLMIEPGAKFVFEWSTDIIAMYDGTEQRISPFGQPRRRLEGTAHLVDATSRDSRGALMRSAARASTFLLALPIEEITITADSIGNAVTVATTALADWALPGQRCLIVAPDGSAVGVVVQSIAATVIIVRRVDAAGMITTTALGSAGRAGGRIMPLLPVLLDAMQGFSRYAVTVDLWALHAMANAFGWVGTDTMGVGARIVTFTAGVSVAIADITDDDLLIWDRPNAIEGTASEAMQSYVDVVDLGAMPLSIGGALVPAWQRSIKLRSGKRADWQWLKAFLRRVRGRQRSFLLPTNRPDLVYDSTVGSSIKVKSPSVAGSGDYASWFASRAYRRLAVTLANGTVQYVAVQTVTDNLDGTLTLALDTGVTGTVARVSYLEQVRFDRDAIEVSWNGGVFSIDEKVIATREAIDTQALRLFDTVVSVDFRYTGIFPDVPPSDQKLMVQLGKTTLVNWTSDRTLNFGGIHATGGNVDGMVVCIAVVNNSAAGISLLHEDATFAATDRLWNHGLTGVTGVGISPWYRYNSTIGRWINIA